MLATSLYLLTDTRVVRITSRAAVGWFRWRSCITWPKTQILILRRDWSERLPLAKTSEILRRSFKKSRCGGGFSRFGSKITRCALFKCRSLNEARSFLSCIYVGARTIVSSPWKGVTTRIYLHLLVSTHIFSWVIHVRSWAMVPDRGSQIVGDRSAS